MNCSNCGKEINNLDKFCAHCGSLVNNDTIKADVKVEITNATTEKAFKAVGNTISSGKQAVVTGAKATTGFAKKIMIPVIILAIIGGIVFYSHYQQEQEELEAYRMEREAEELHCIGKREEIKRNMTEKQSCVYNEYNSTQDRYEDPWGITRTLCDLSYSELMDYKKWYSESFKCY